MILASPGKSTLTVMLVASVAMADGALAQQAKSDSVAQLEEVVVTATKRAV
jgi:hypothetical protein